MYKEITKKRPAVKKPTMRLAGGRGFMYLNADGMKEIGKSTRYVRLHIDKTARKIKVEPTKDKSAFSLNSTGSLYSTGLWDSIKNYKPKTMQGKKIGNSLEFTY
jgi:hypothetical protein